MRSVHILVLASLPLATTAACGEDHSPGTVKMTVYGEEYIEEGIPSSVFADGWSVSFDKFVVSIGNVRAEAGHDAEEIGPEDFFIVDLAQDTGGEGTELATIEDAPGGEYDHFGYQIQDDATGMGVNVDAADVTAVHAAGASLWVQGSATKGDVTKTFDWIFTAKLTYAHCDTGLTLDGDEITLQATIHADHLFFDDAVSEEPDTAFDLVAAADSNDDNIITEAELEATDIRGETRYQVGSNRDPDGDEIENLWQYIAHQATTVGHVNGEGHCEDTIVVP